MCDLILFLGNKNTVNFFKKYDFILNTYFYFIIFSYSNALSSFNYLRNA